MKKLSAVLLIVTLLLVGCGYKNNLDVQYTPHDSPTPYDTERTESARPDGMAEESVEESVPETEVQEPVAEVVVPSSKCEIHFIDVGQGDCTLIICGDEAMLIDAGTYEKGTAIQLYLQKEGVESLKYFIATHPDADHIGAAGVILTKFPVENMFMPNVSKDTKAYDSMVKAIGYKHIKPINPTVGNTYTLGEGNFTILNPGTREYEDINDSSIAFMFRFGFTKVLFIGDCEKESQTIMLEEGADLNADIYKAGHHGSSTSSGMDFIKAVTPIATIISCGEDNDYGHPHAETLNNLREIGSDVYRTDEQGTIVLKLDGKKFEFNTPPTESWSSGEYVVTGGYDDDMYVGRYWNTYDDTGMFHSNGGDEIEIDAPAEDVKSDVTTDGAVNE